jgi:hypothetical protein
MSSLALVQSDKKEKYQHLRFFSNIQLSSVFCMGPGVQDAFSLVPTLHGAEEAAM